MSDIEKKNRNSINYFSNKLKSIEDRLITLSIGDMYLQVMGFLWVVVGTISGTFAATISFFSFISLLYLNKPIT